MHTATNEWSVAEVVLLRQMVQGGKDSQVICEEFNKAGIPRSQKAIYRKLQAERDKDPGQWRVRVADSPFPALPSPVTIEGDCLVLADLHSPFHDAHWVNRVTDLALKWGVCKAGVCGDAVDFSAFSHFGRQHYLEAEMELDAVKQVLDSLANGFDEVVYAPGNHEMRFARWVAYALDAQALIQHWVNNEKVTTTRFHWFRVVSGGEVYQVEHPRNTSTHASVIPAKLCAKFGCHVIAGHGHTWGMTRDDSGRYWAIDSGICADPRRLEFGQIEHNTRPVQMQGAVIIKGGVPILLCPENIGLYG
jgi:hypothetical protein